MGTKPSIFWRLITLLFTWPDYVLIILTHFNPKNFIRPIWPIYGNNISTDHLDATHFGPWPLRSMTISVLGTKWSSTSVHDHFGPWLFRSNMKISWPFRSMTRSVHDHFGPWQDRSMISSVFSLCVKWTIGPSCQVAMCMIGVKRKPLSIPLPTLTPASKVQISGGWLQLTLINFYQITDEV